MTDVVVTRNPATGEELHRYPAHDEAGVEQALADTAAARRSGRRPRSRSGWRCCAASGSCSPSGVRTTPP